MSEPHTKPTLLFETEKWKRLTLDRLERVEELLPNHLPKSENCMADNPHNVLKGHFATLSWDRLRSRDRKERRALQNP
jgi:hypothetical protein